MSNYFFKLPIDDAYFYKQKKILRDNVKQIVVKSLKRDFPHYKIKEVKLRKVQINPQDFSGEVEAIEHISYVMDNITAFVFDLSIDNKFYNAVYVPYSGILDLFVKDVILLEDIVLRETVVYKQKKNADVSVKMTVFWDSVHLCE